MVASLVLPQLAPTGLYSQSVVTASLAEFVQPVPEKFTPPAVTYEPDYDVSYTPGQRSPGFFGEERSNLINRILNRVADPSQPTIHKTIATTRRAGKTTLIDESLSRAVAHSEVKALKLDLINISCKLELYKKMASVLGLEDVNAADPDALKDRCFVELDHLSRHKRVALYIDEAGALHKADIGFFRKLREMKDRVSVIFLSFVEDQVYHAQEKLMGLEGANASFSPSLNHFVKEILPPFNAQDVARFVSARLFGSPDVAPYIAPGFVESVILFTGGNVCMIEALLQQLQDGAGMKAWVAEIFDKNHDSLYFTEKFYQIPNFLDHILAQFEYLILAPFEGSQYLEVSPKSIFRKMIEESLKQGTTTLKYEDIFGTSKLAELGISPENRPFLQRIITYFSDVGLISLSVQDGQTFVHLDNLLLFMHFAKQRTTHTFEQLVRLFNGENFPVDKAQAERQALVAHRNIPVIDAEAKVEILSHLRSQVGQRYGSTRPETSRTTTLNMMLCEMLDVIRVNFGDDCQFSFPYSTCDDFQQLMTMTTSLIGKDPSRIFEFALCVYQVARDKFNQSSVGDETTFVMNANVVMDAFMRFNTSRTAENYFPDWAVILK